MVLKKLRPLRPKAIVTQDVPRELQGQQNQSQPRLPDAARGPIMVGMPTGKPSIYTGTVKSLFSSHPYMAQFGHITFYSHAGSLIHVARQETLDMAIRSGMRWLWFIDDDMTFPPETPLVLAKTCVEHDFTACSALAIKRVPPYSPTVGMRVDENGEPMLTPEEVPERGVHEVLHTGLACTVIDIDKMKKVGLDRDGKIFYMQVNEANTKMIGEDLAFCKILQDRGLKVGLNADIWTGHLGVHEFKPDIWFKHWRQEFIMKKKEHQEMEMAAKKAAPQKAPEKKKVKKAK